MALFLASCSQGDGRHYRYLKGKVEEIGARTIVADATQLMEQYSGGNGRSTPFQRMDTSSSSLTNFSSQARVTPDQVSITTAGLGSHRLGLTIVRDAANPALGTNVKWIADNIYYWQH